VEWRTTISDFILVMLKPSHNQAGTIQIGKGIMRSLTWTIMGLVLAFFTNGCAMHNFSMHDPIKDARMTKASVHSDKVVATELACEGPSTVCEVP
jgi:hypothetical protein